MPSLSPTVLKVLAAFVTALAVALESAQVAPPGVITAAANAALFLLGVKHPAPAPKV